MSIVTILCCIVALLGAPAGGASVDADRTYAALKSRLLDEPNSLILTFRDDLEQMLDAVRAGPSAMVELDVELLHARYMGNLRDLYLKKFVSCAGRGDVVALAREGAEECRTTMLMSTPVSHLDTWGFEGFVGELQQDMATYIDGLKAIETKIGDNPILRPAEGLWRKRLRWLSVQCLVLAVNVMQGEWQRRAMRRASARRLAEVPEFPLL